MHTNFRRPKFHLQKRVVRQRFGTINSASLKHRLRATQGLVGLSESILDVLVTIVLFAEQGSIPSALRTVAAKVQALQSHRIDSVRNRTAKGKDNDSVRWKARWHFCFCQSIRELSQP